MSIDVIKDGGMAYTPVYPLNYNPATDYIVPYKRKPRNYKTIPINDNCTFNFDILSDNNFIEPPNKIMEEIWNVALELNKEVENQKDEDDFIVIEDRNKIFTTDTRYKVYDKYEELLCYILKNSLSLYKNKKNDYSLGKVDEKSVFLTSDKNDSNKRQYHNDKYPCDISLGQYCGIDGEPKGQHVVSLDNTYDPLKNYIVEVKARNDFNYKMQIGKLYRIHAILNGLLEYKHTKTNKFHYFPIELLCGDDVLDDNGNINPINEKIISLKKLVKKDKNFFINECLRLLKQQSVKRQRIFKDMAKELGYSNFVGFFDNVHFHSSGLVDIGIKNSLLFTTFVNKLDIVSNIINKLDVYQVNIFLNKEHVNNYFRNDGYHVGDDSNEDYLANAFSNATFRNKYGQIESFEMLPLPYANKESSIFNRPTDPEKDTYSLEIDFYPNMKPSLEVFEPLDFTNNEYRLAYYVQSYNNLYNDDNNDNIDEDDEEGYVEGYGKNNKDCWALHKVYIKKPMSFEKAYELAHNYIKDINKIFVKEYPNKYNFRNIPKSKFSKFRGKIINDDITLIYGQLKPENCHLEGSGHIVPFMSFTDEMSAGKMKYNEDISYLQPLLSFKNKMNENDFNNFLYNNRPPVINKIYLSKGSGCGKTFIGQIKKEVNESGGMKHSAYRSMQLAKQGKTKKRDGNLRKWIDEDWRNLTPYAEGLTSLNETPECGKPHPDQKGKSVCRPMKKINKSTPEIASTYSKDQIKKAVQSKNKGETIKWSKL